MKRFLSVFLTVLMLFSLLILPVNAEDDSTVNLIVGETVLSTLTGNVGEAVPYTVPDAPEGKYFIGWFDKDGKPVEKFVSGATDVYASFGEYKASTTIDYTKTLFEEESKLPLYYGYTYDGVYYGSVRVCGNAANKGRTAQLNHTANENGILIANGANSYSKYGGTDDTGLTFAAGQDKNGSTTYGDMAVGDTAVIGWGQGDYLTVRNSDGSFFAVKPNTAYKISVTYKVTGIGAGTSLMGISIGMFEKDASSNGNGYSNHTDAFNVNTANRVAIKAVNEDYVTETVILNSGSLEGAVPSICVNFSLGKVIGEKTGVSKEITGGTSYQFKVIDRTEVLVKEIKVAEVAVSNVTVIDGENKTVLSGEAGETIPYDTTVADRSYDVVYSLSSTEYVPAPTVFGSSDVTVYLLKSSTISFENYPEISHISTSVNVGVSDEMAYSGNKSYKWISTAYGVLKTEPSDWATKWTKYFTFDGKNYESIATETAPAFEVGKYYKYRSNVRESAIGLWRLEAGKSYKITYKYYVKNKLGTTLEIEPYTNGTNLWVEYNAETKKGMVNYKEATTSISVATKTGEWLDGSIYITVADVASKYEYLYLWLTGATSGDDAVYFDDFSYTEMDTVKFDTGALGVNIPEFEGNQVSTVYTVYKEKGSTFTAPQVKILSYKAFGGWYKDSGFTEKATEFSAGSTYYLRTLSRGDCDESGAVDTGDLAALKLNLAGSGEVNIDAADVTKDDKVDTTDLADLKLTLAGVNGKTDELKVLGIGNSFTVDGTQYLWNVATAAGEEEFLLARATIGGCDLDKHWSNIENDSAAYSFSVNDDGDWDNDANTSAGKLSDILKLEWDVIVIQQVSQKSGLPDTYGNLQNIINYIKEKCPNAKIMWQMTWAYQSDSTHAGFADYNNDQMTMYNAIIDTANELIVSNPDIDGIIPSGTAIQNLRTVIGDNLTRDGYHMSYDYGRYTVALTWYKAITGKSIDEVFWVPASYSYIGKNLEAVKSSVNDAIDNPFEVTNQAN